MYTIKLMNKSYNKRKINVYDGKKLIIVIMPYCGWYSVSTSNKELRAIAREIALDNLYWLLGHDISFEDWIKHIEDWDNGKCLYGVPVDKLSSMFFNKTEKELALNSFNKWEVKYDYRR